MNGDPIDPAKTQIMSEPALAGGALKQFRLENLIGQGGMGLVYRAHDSRLHRQVAVKILPSALTADPERKQRFLQEARAAARISHPAIAQIFDADEQDGVTFIVMELVEGKTVRQLIDQGELDILSAIDIGVMVADGLAKAHELGIVHRDIKPANVMRTKDGHVKVLDFGLAKLLPSAATRPAVTDPLPPLQPSMTRTDIIMGTPAYMSPEQLRGLPVDARTDIFAVGVLVFEMVTGQSPFQRATAVDAIHATAFEETPIMNSPRAHIPEELQRIVSRCLKKRPDERYPNAALLASDLKVLRRQTEAGLAHHISWRQRALDLWDEVSHLPRSQYLWYGIGLVIAVLALSLSLAKIGAGGLVFLTVAALLVYRHIRNRPLRVQEMLVRRISKLPEVRLITLQKRQFNVVVDRPVAQLYGRINGLLQSANRELYHGEPLTLSVLHDLTDEQLHQLLTSPGVHYVREEEKKPTASQDPHQKPES
jgi:serine/threonine protein kinase